VSVAFVDIERDTLVKELAASNSPFVGSVVAASFGAPKMEVPMPVGVRIDLPGATLEWYDEVIATAGFLPGGPLVTSALSHWVTKTDDGI
jgi:hypothetical protein